MAVKGKVRKRIFDIIQIGNKSDIPSAVFDLFITLTIFVNLFVTFYSTFQSAQKYSSTLTIRWSIFSVFLRRIISIRRKIPSWHVFFLFSHSTDWLTCLRFCRPSCRSLFRAVRWLFESSAWSEFSDSSRSTRSMMRSM